MADPLEQLSDSDLQALAKNDLHAMSDQGLQIVAASGNAPASAAKPEPSMAASGARQAISGFAGGFDDELSGAVSAAGRLAGVKNLGTWKPLNPDSHLQMDEPTADPEKLMEAYRDNRDAARQEQHQDIAAHPVVSTVANTAGMFANPLLRSMGPAAMGATQGLGNSEADLTQGDVAGAATDTAKSAALFYAAGKAGDMAGKALTPAAEAIAPTVSKEVETGLLDSAGKPITKTIQEAAPAVAEAAPKADGFLGKIADKALTFVGAKLGGPLGAVAAPYVRPAITSAANGLSQVLKNNPAFFGKWAPVLAQAAARGEVSLNASAYILQQQDPEFRQKMEQLNTHGAQSIGSSH